MLSLKSTFLASFAKRGDQREINRSCLVGKLSVAADAAGRCLFLPCAFLYSYLDSDAMAGRAAVTLCPEVALRIAGQKDGGLGLMTPCGHHRSSELPVCTT